MPIIKISSTDLTKPKLIAVDSFNELKEKAKAKQGFEIVKFMRKSDGSEVDDDDVLHYLLAEEKELWLVCLADGQEYSPAKETQINQDELLKTMQDLLTKAKNESINDLIKESIRSEPDHVTSKVLDTSSDEKEDLPFQENPISNKIRISQPIGGSGIGQINEEEKILKTIQDLITDKKSSIKISSIKSEDEKPKEEAQDEILKTMQDFLDKTNPSISSNVIKISSQRAGDPLKVITVNENNILKTMQDFIEKTNTNSSSNVIRISSSQKLIDPQIISINQRTAVNDLVAPKNSLIRISNVRPVLEEEKEVAAEKPIDLTITDEEVQNVNLFDGSANDNPLNLENKIMKSMQDLITANNESIENVLRNSMELNSTRITRPLINENNNNFFINNPDPVEFMPPKTTIPINQQKIIISNLFNQMIQAEKVDICFMLDCTGSMKTYIDHVKSTLNNIVNKLKLKFRSFELRLSFVGYRDHFDHENRVTYLPFVNNIETFQTFLSDIKATGGQDQAEDVIGGLEQVSKLEWFNPTRVLIHIGDAPQHGLRFHEADITDDFPGGDPRNVNLTELFRELIDKQINYYFAEINKSTIKMIDEFNKEIVSNHGKKIKKFQLSSVEDLTALIARTINASINETKKTTRTLDQETKKLELNNSDKIDWSPESSDFKKLNAIQHIAKYNGQIKELKTKPIDYTEKPIEISIAKQPFDKGSLRYAFAALINVGTKENPNYIKSVAKQTIYKAKEYNDIKYYKDIIENQVIASYLAKKFFDVTKPEKSIRFIDVSLVYVPETDSYYTLEEYIDGDFVKWISNDGTINQDIYSCTLDAFSHWTYIISKKYLLVTDLQGALVVSSNYILTDPAISSAESEDRFTNTNLGQDGIDRFFQSHQCNHICKYLVLEKHDLQELPDRADFEMMTKLMSLKPFETA